MELLLPHIKQEICDSHWVALYLHYYMIRVDTEHEYFRVDVFHNLVRGADSMPELMIGWVECVRVTHIIAWYKAISIPPVVSDISIRKWYPSLCTHIQHADKILTVWLLDTSAPYVRIVCNELMKARIRLNYACLVEIALRRKGSKHGSRSYIWYMVHISAL